MSGYKRSKIEFERQQAERLRLLGEVKQAQTKVAALAAGIKESIEKAPLGVRETYQREVGEAQEWLSADGKQDKAPTSATVESLRSTLSSLSSAATRGEQLLNRVVDSLTQKADAMEKAARKNLAVLEVKCSGGQSVLETWFRKEAVNEFDKSIGYIRQLLGHRQLGEAQQRLQYLQEKLDTRLGEANDLERKHQNRLYVLKGLRQVCQELGFQEAEPHYETADKRGRIVYAVDTLDEGKITFYLTLDGISSQSAIDTSQCWQEFDKLSELLKSEFGIKTRFSGLDGRPDDARLEKGAKDLPDDEDHVLENTA